MIYLLKIIDQYECRMGVLETVVRACSEQHARELVRESAKHDPCPDDWMDKTKSTCEALEPSGPPEIYLEYIPFY